MRRTATWMGLVLALIAVSVPAQADDSLRVLFIGNSYTRFNDLPAMVEAVAASVPDGPHLEAERETHGGYNLRRHWRVERVRDLVAHGGFQRVVLQPHSLSPLNETDELSEYAARFQAHATAAGADVVLFQTWARHPESTAYGRLNVDDATAMSERLETVYSRLGAELDAPVAPVGNAWRRALSEDPDLELHRDDGTHPAVMGTYLSALVLYGTLTGVDPRRVQWRHWRIPRRRAARIRQIAAETLGHGDEVAEDAPGEAPPEAAALGGTDLGETDLGETDLGETDLGETDLGETDLGETAEDSSVGEIAEETAPVVDEVDPDIDVRSGTDADPEGDPTAAPPP